MIGPPSEPSRKSSAPVDNLSLNGHPNLSQVLSETSLVSEVTVDPDIDVIHFQSKSSLFSSKLIQNYYRINTEMKELTIMIIFHSESFSSRRVAKTYRHILEKLHIQRGPRDRKFRNFS